MKIFHLITTLNTGGAEMMLYKLLSRQNRQYFSSRVVSLIPPGPVGDRIKKQGIPVDHLNLTPGRVTPKALLRLKGLLQTFDPDILQTWLYHSDLLGIVAGKWAGVKKIAWNIRSSNMNFADYRMTSKWTMGLCRRLSGWPDAVITNSHIAKDYHRKLGYHPKEFIVIPSGFDLNRFRLNPAARSAVRKELNIAETNFCIAMIARYDPKKDHHTFFRAISKLNREDQKVNIICCGDSVTNQNQDLRKHVSDSGIDSIVQLLGRRDDIDDIMSAVDLVVLSSAYGEGFPNVIGEAMACEKVCVVTDTGDSAIIVGDKGKTVPPRDPDALARAINEVLQMSSEDRLQMGRDARMRIQTHFALDHIVEQYEKTYRRLNDGASE